MYYFYIVRCSDNSLYCGQTNNLARRIREHNGGASKSAKYTKYRGPVVLVYSEKHSTLHLAMSRELEVKKWTKKRKEEMIRAQ